jgi:hypothetical protein
VAKQPVNVFIDNRTSWIGEAHLNLGGPKQLSMCCYRAWPDLSQRKLFFESVRLRKWRIITDMVGTTQPDPVWRRIASLV